jgi:hypothetical protein
MNENELYNPFMLSCSLIRYHVVKKNRELVPSIYPTRNGYGYSWSDFFVEFNLDMEVSCIHQKNKKMYFVHIGTFSKSCFTILEQIRQKKSIRISGICSTQADLIKNIATEDIEPLDFTTSGNGDSSAFNQSSGNRRRIRSHQGTYE